MAGIKQDLSRWPVVVFTYTGRYSEADVLEHIEGLRALTRAGRPCGVIFQLTGARVFSAKERSLFAEFIRAERGVLTRICKAASLVTTNTLHHGVLTAVAWITPMPCPVKIFSQLDEAQQWVKGYALDKVRAG